MRLLKFTPTQEERETFPHFQYAETCWRTDDGRYWVTENRVGRFCHIKIHRTDHAKLHDFSTLQTIKNLTLGADAVAVQVFPKDSDLVDGSNTYHLWAWSGIEEIMPNLKQMPRYH